MADPIEVITTEQLSAYPGVGTLDASDAAVVFLIATTNALVTEKWRNPVDPIPTSITLLALEVAARALRNPKGLSSWTKSADDASKTERLPDRAARAGIYLTGAETRKLRGVNARPRFGTVRTPIGY